MKNRTFFLPKSTILLLTLTGCEKTGKPGPSKVITSDATAVTTYSATVGGEIISDGGYSLIAKIFTGEHHRIPKKQVQK